jgi:peroxiredoxin
MAILPAGATAPELELVDADGVTRSLAAERAGGLALVTFFSLECRACDLSYVFWDRMHEAYAAAGCPVLDGVETAARFYEDSGVSFAVLGDPGNALARAYGIECTPALFLVDGAGTIVASHDAFDRAALNALSAEIAKRLGVAAEALSEGEAPASSPGCTVHLSPA